MHTILTPGRTVLLSCIAIFLLAAPATGFAQSQLPTFDASFAPSTIGPSSVSALQFDITNPSSLPARNLTFTNNLPGGVTIAAPANASSTCLGTLSAPAGGSTISLSDGGIGAGESCTISVDVTSSTPGTHTNVTGDLTSDAGNSGTASADLTVDTERPGFRKSFSPSSVFYGGRSTLTLTIDNTASTSAATQLTFTDNLPSGMVVASPSFAATDCLFSNLSASGGGSVISMTPDFAATAAAVDAGASCSVTVDVVAQATGVLGNTSGVLASALWPNGTVRHSGKAAAELTVTTEQISLSKSFVDDPAVPGHSTTLEFTVRNLDRGFSATNITFSDDLDAVLAGLVATGLPASDLCGAGSQLAGSSVITLTGGELPPEGSCTFAVTLQVPTTAASDVYTNTTSAITADIGGVPVVGDPASDLLAISPGPLLTKTFLDDPVGAGNPVVLEFNIINTSPSSTATDISFEDVFAVELPTASDTPLDGFCGTDSVATYTPLVPVASGSSIPARLVVSGAELAPSASCSFSLTLDVAVGAAAGSYLNTTTAITATIDGATESGSPASDSLEIVAAPRLTMDFVGDPVAPGGVVTVTFTLDYDEASPGDATDITFDNDLEAALAGLAATGLPLNDVCGAGSQINGTSTLSFTGGYLVPGDSCTFGVPLVAPATASPGAHESSTSAVTASVLGITATGSPASAELQIAGLVLGKEFTDDPVLPGGSVNLRFTIANISPTASTTDITFTDNLDEVVDGMSATGLPAADICGVGSSLSASAGDTFLVFAGGSLAPGVSCTFDVALEVPSGAAPGTFPNLTSPVTATVEGSTVDFPGAFDELTIASDFLLLSKEFTDDPVSPGETVNLHFEITNLNPSEPITGIAFTDDLDAALEGLVGPGVVLNDVCGVGSQISGTNLLTFTAGSLAAGGSCAFDVPLTVPLSVPLGATGHNITSEATGTMGGLAVTGYPATDELWIDYLLFHKAFSGDVAAGDTVTLTFTIENLSTTASADELSFTDDLDGVIQGLQATGLPAFDVCGAGSELAGTSLLMLINGSLGPSGSCTVNVSLQVPPDAAVGSYLNVTSDLEQRGIHRADPATATLNVLEVVDGDDDGVLDSFDLCPGTVIPEGVPTIRLGVNRFALVDDDYIFDTRTPNGSGPEGYFTTTDTAGCSCEQIIEELDLGAGHVKFGCSLGAMRTWVHRADTVLHGVFADGFATGDLEYWSSTEP